MTIDISDLGEVEQRMMLHIVERLRMGYKTYGPIYRGKREWVKEAKEEAIDASIYLLALLEEFSDE